MLGSRSCFLPTMWATLCLLLWETRFTTISKKWLIALRTLQTALAASCLSRCDGDFCAPISSRRRFAFRLPERIARCSQFNSYDCFDSGFVTAICGHLGGILQLHRV